MTAVLGAQLPTSSISADFSKARVQFVSSVGCGSTYGTETAFFSRSRSATRGYFGAMEGMERVEEFLERRRAVIVGADVGKECINL